MLLSTSPLTLHIPSSEDLRDRGCWLEGRHSNTQLGRNYSD